MLYNDLSRVQPELKITRMAPTGDPGAELTPPTQAIQPTVVHLIGGRESSFGLFYIEDSWPTGTFITRFRAKLTVDGGAPIDLNVRLEPNSMGNISSASVAVPDVHGTGTIDVKVDWRDSCFVYEAEVSTPTRIYSAESVAGCPRKRDAAFDELNAAFEPPARVGPVDADLVPWRFGGKVADLAIGDTAPPYVGFGRDSPSFETTTGATIQVSNPNDEIELHIGRSVDVVFFRRGPLVRWIEGGWIHGNEPKAEIVDRSDLIEHPDGTFTFDAPTDPGRYVAQVVFDYDSACSIGTAGFAVGVEVVVP